MYILSRAQHFCKDIDNLFIITMLNVKNKAANVRMLTNPPAC